MSAQPQPVLFGVRAITASLLAYHLGIHVSVEQDHKGVVAQLVKEEGLDRHLVHKLCWQASSTESRLGIAGFEPEVAQCMLLLLLPSKILTTC